MVKVIMPIGDDVRSKDVIVEVSKPVSSKIALPNMTSTEITNILTLGVNIHVYITPEGGGRGSGFGWLLKPWKIRSRLFLRRFSQVNLGNSKCVSCSIFEKIYTICTLLSAEFGIPSFATLLD